MKQFVKKQVIVGAERFQIDEKNPPRPGIHFLHWPILVDSMGWHLLITTLEGTMRCDNGDWVIRGVKGEFYPCKDDIFKMSYEPLNTGEVYGGPERRKRSRLLVPPPVAV